MTKLLKDLTIQDIGKLSSADLLALLNELFTKKEVTDQINNNADLKAKNIIGSTVYDYFKQNIEKFGNLLIINQMSVTAQKYVELVNSMIYNYYNTVNKIKLNDEGLSKFIMNYNLSKCDLENRYFSDPSCKTFKDFTETNAPLWVTESPSGAPLTLASIGNAVLKSCSTPWGSLGYWNQCEDHTWGYIYIIILALILLAIIYMIIKYRAYIANQAKETVNNAMQLGMVLSESMQQKYENMKNSASISYDNMKDSMSTSYDNMKSSASNKFDDLKDRTSELSKQIKSKLT